MKEQINAKKQKKTYYLYGWHNESDYDAGKDADCSKSFKAHSLSQAEDMADRYFTKHFGKCDVLTDCVVT